MGGETIEQNGSLAVASGRNVVHISNTLLNYPFTVKVATKDWHPPSHISFASNHPPPNNKPVTSFVDIVNPNDPSEKIRTILWPDHCVQNTPGAELLPELNSSLLNKIIEKGTDERVEMYSAFQDPFKTRVTDSGLSQMLKKENVTHLYIVGLAFDYCVKCTAIDGSKNGFQVYVVKEGTKAVFEDAVQDTIRELDEHGVKVVGMDSEELKWVKDCKS